MNDLNKGITPPRPAKIQARGLVKTFRTNGVLVEVLSRVDLDIILGETVAIAGASGVGKSPLLHILGTMERPTAGKVLWDGADILRIFRSSLGHGFPQHII